MEIEDITAVTNNPQLRAKYAATVNLIYLAEPTAAVLRRARDMAHRGHRLLSDPAASRQGHRPNPYSTVFLRKRAGEPDWFSLACLENALHREEQNRTDFAYDNTVLHDFQLVELALAESVLGALR